MKLYCEKAGLCVLAAVLMLGTLSACGETAEEPTTTEERETVSPTTDSEEIYTDSLDARRKVSDGVPELDFNGQDFRIFYQKRYTTDAISPDDKETGDVLNDAVFRRNQTVSERFNINIVGIEGEEGPMVKTLMNAVSAGENAYDLFMGHSMSSGEAALAGCFYNWYDIEYMDFTKPWFPQSAIEALTMNGRMYLTIADMCLSAISNAYCMYFNKQIAADNDLDSIYSIIRDNKWTVEKLTELTKDIYRDVNGNGIEDEEDLFGFIGENEYHIATWLYACDVPTIRFGDEGSVSLVFNSDRTASLLSRIRTLYNDTTGSYHDKKANYLKVTSKN